MLCLSQDDRALHADGALSSVQGAHNALSAISRHIRSVQDGPIVAAVCLLLRRLERTACSDRLHGKGADSSVERARLLGRTRRYESGGGARTRRSGTAPASVTRMCRAHG